MGFKINSLYLTDGYKVGHQKMLAPGTTKLYGTWIPRSTKHAPKGITKIVSFGQQLVWKWLHGEFEENFFHTEEYYEEVAKLGGLQGVSPGTGEHLKSIYKEKALQFVKDMSLYLGMEYDGKHFEELWDLGYLPIKVKALPEGIETNPNIPHMTFVNTVDGFAWLTLYLETVVSSLAWKPSTAATIAKLYRRQCEEWVAKTDKENMWLVDFMCHDFSARGLDPMSQYLIGLGHATSFKGSDTLPVIPASRYFYGVKEDEMPIFSVNASEHSVSTTKIFTVGENQMIADWLKIFPKGILSIVADTFDLWKLITEYLPANKEAIMARDGKLVIRPDSGNPVDIICGVGTKYEDLSKWFPDGEVLPEYFEDSLLEEVREDTPHGECGASEHENIYIVRGKLYKAKIHNISWNRYDKQYYYIDMWEKAKITIEELPWKPSDKGVIELLWDIFGGTINEQGYKVLDPHIGAIYGDSITPERQVQIYERLAAKGFAATNIVLGVGSFTYQYNTRDTLGFAAKGGWFEVDNSADCVADCKTCKCVKENKSTDFCNHKLQYNIFKDPVTDDGQKRSLKGLLGVFVEGEPYHENYFVKQECTWEEESQGLLQTIYEDGKFYNQTTLEEIRNRLSNGN
jgi:nicotinamide phosphoribosyltransferase